MKYKALRIENEKNIVTFNYVQYQLFTLQSNNYEVVKHKLTFNY